MSKHIIPSRSNISEHQRQVQNGHKAAVLWLTGLPASGKTTIAVQLEQILFQKKIQTFNLDGDNIRGGLSADLGFSIEERVENIRRCGEVAKLFYEAGFLLIVSLISPIRASRQCVRDLFPAGRFIEVFVDCPLRECERRDPKGHYAMARKGEVPFFTGVSADYEAPLRPEIHLKTNELSVEACVQKIIDYLTEQKIIS